MKTIRYSTNLRRTIWVSSPENRRWKNIWSSGFSVNSTWTSRRPLTRVHVDVAVDVDVEVHVGRCSAGEPREYRLLRRVLPKKIHRWANFSRRWSRMVQWQCILKRFAECNRTFCCVSAYLKVVKSWHFQNCIFDNLRCPEIKTFSLFFSLNKIYIY
jgi:hypothetical protein